MNETENKPAQQQPATPPPTASTGGKKPKSQAVKGCLGCLGICVVLFVVFGAMLNSCAPSTKIAGDTAKIHYEAAAFQTAALAGQYLARDIWSTAKSHPEIKQIEATIELTGDKIVDSYGKEEKGPYIMGTIVESDLNEVRKYESADAFWVSAHAAMYGVQIKGLKYGHCFSGKD